MKGGEEHVWDTSEQIQSTTGHDGARIKGLSETLVFTFVVLHNILRTHHGGADRSPTPANDIVDLQIEPVVHKNDGSVTSSRQGVDYTGLSGSRS